MLGTIFLLAAVLGYDAPRAAQPVTVDGRMDEAAWQAAPWTPLFVDIEGDGDLVGGHAAEGAGEAFEDAVAVGAGVHGDGLGRGLRRPGVGDVERRRAVIVE